MKRTRLSGEDARCQNCGWAARRPGARTAGRDHARRHGHAVEVVVVYEPLVPAVIPGQTVLAVSR